MRFVKTTRGADLGGCLILARYCARQSSAFIHPGTPKNKEVVVVVSRRGPQYPQAVGSCIYLLKLEKAGQVEAATAIGGALPACQILNGRSVG